MSDELLLIGSIPLDTVQDVFESFGATLGLYLSAIPQLCAGSNSRWLNHVFAFAAHRLLLDERSG